MLEVRNLSKSFAVAGAERRVIRDLNLTVENRAFFMILGQSGCGKSTLLRIIGGFEKPDRGEILLDGKPVEKPSKDIMMVFQDFEQLFPWFTLKKNLVYALKKAKVAIPGRDYDGYVRRYLKMAGLEGFEDSFPHQLSGGMKQRGALARALCLKPGVLLLDEPFSSLDPVTKQGLYTCVGEMAGQTGTTVVMVTHDIGEALVLGTSIAVLSKETGRFLDLFARGAEGFEPGAREGLEACLEGQGRVRGR